MLNNILLFKQALHDKNTSLILQILCDAKLLTLPESECCAEFIKTAKDPIFYLFLHFMLAMTPETQSRWTQLLQALVAHHPPLTDTQYAFLFIKAGAITAVNSIQILVDLKLPINARLENVESVLENAIIHQKTELIKRLIDIPEVDLNSQNLHNSLGYSPLHYAVHYNQPDTVTHLLRKPSLVLTVQDIFGCTALDMAVISGKLSLVALFKQAVPDLANTPIGKKARKYAQTAGHQKIVELLTPHPTLSKHVPLTHFTQPETRTTSAAPVLENTLTLPLLTPIPEKR